MRGGQAFPNLAASDQMASPVRQVGDIWGSAALASPTNDAESQDDVETRTSRRALVDTTKNTRTLTIVLAALVLCLFGPLVAIANGLVARIVIIVLAFVTLVAGAWMLKRLGEELNEEDTLPQRPLGATATVTRVEVGSNGVTLFAKFDESVLGLPDTSVVFSSDPNPQLTPTEGMRVAVIGQVGDTPVIDTVRDSG